MAQAKFKVNQRLSLTCILILSVAASATADTGNRSRADGTTLKTKLGAGQYEIRLETRLPTGELTRRSASSSAADQVPDASSSAAGGNCGGCSAGTDGQIGFGPPLQECGDGSWSSLAVPVNISEFDTLRFTVNTNRSGGDIYIMEDAGDCQPDISQIVHTFCCVLEGLETTVEHELHFPLTVGELNAPTWVVFVPRSDLSGQDEDGIFNGTTFPSHQVARDTTSGSEPGRAFFNLAGTGNPGDWADADGIGNGLGNCYAISLHLTGQEPDPPPDCANVPTGACCLGPTGGQDCVQTRGFECPTLGGVYLGDGTACEDCPVCGNGVDELGEQCDGGEAEACLDGACRDDCVCVCDIPLEGAPENDCCGDRLEIGVGDTAYDTTNAQTDGLPSPDGLCNDFGSPQTGNDIWYNFTAECNGSLLVSTCGGAGVCNMQTTECEGGAFDGFTGCAQDSDCDGGGPGGFAQYDSDLVLYEGCDECPPSPDNIVDCNDDFLGLPCGDVLFSSVLNAEVQGGTCYKLRVGGFGVGQFGPGVLHVELECIVPEESLIIKQGATPAPVNPNSNGVIPMVLAGSDTLDVSTVDPDSLRLRRCDGEGGEMAPLAEHTKIKDLNHPAGPVECPGCSDNDNQSSDGVDDLSLKFRTDETLAMLDLGVGNGVVTVELIGTSAAGNFVVRDCMVVVPPGVGQSTLTLGANVGDTFVKINPLDINVDSDGFTSFSRGYIAGTSVTLTAPATSEGRKFVRWSVDGVLQPVGRRTLQMTAGADANLKAIYAHGARLDVDRPTADEGSEE